MPQQMQLSHEDLTALLWRYEHMREALTPEQVQLIEQGESTAQSATAYGAALTPCHDAYNLSPQAKAKAKQAAEFAALTVASNLGEYQPPVKDRSYYRSRYSSFSGRKECEAHRQSLGLEGWQYRRWLNASEPQQQAASSTPQAVAWAEQVLGGAA